MEPNFDHSSTTLSPQLLERLQALERNIKKMKATIVQQNQSISELQLENQRLSQKLESGDLHRLPPSVQHRIKQIIERIDHHLEKTT